jgi:hypothetical protein
LFAVGRSSPFQNSCSEVGIGFTAVLAVCELADESEGTLDDEAEAIFARPLSCISEEGMCCLLQWAICDFHRLNPAHAPSSASRGVLSPSVLVWTKSLLWGYSDSERSETEAQDYGRIAL